MSAVLKARVDAYLRALEAWDGEAVAACYAADAMQIEHPNQLKPKGDRRGVSQMIADLTRGRALLRQQRYEVRALVADGETVAAQLAWTGVLAVPLAGLQPGDEMRADSAVFFRFRDGRIVEQQNYDCFAPLAR